MLVVPWHTLIDGRELVRSEGFSPLRLNVIALKCLLQTYEDARDFQDHWVQKFIEHLNDKIPEQPTKQAT